MSAQADPTPQRVRFGVLGVDGSGEAWMRAVQACPHAQLAVVSDRDPDRTAALAARYHAVPEPDGRAHIVQHRPQAVVMALSPAGAEKLLPPAAEWGVAVVLDRPPARNFEEALARARRFSAARLPLVVVSSWRSMPWPPTFHADAPVIQAHASVVAPLPDPLLWRGDRIRAGGGILLSDAYDAIDAVLALMGLPADVLAHVTRFGQESGPLYDTEDTASLLLRYADGRMATIMARWGPTSTPQCTLTLVRPASVDFVALPPAASLAPLPAHLGPPTSADANPPPAEQVAAVTAVIDAVNAARAPQTSLPRAASAFADHLATLAVVETAYLSARTGAAEAPHLLFERAGEPLPQPPAVAAKNLSP